MGKYLFKSQKNIPMRIAAVLLCLTLFSTYLVTGLFARYTTSAQGGDHARVAKFSFEGSGELLQSIEASLFPGESQTATLIIENNSEVAVEYTVAVTNVTNNLPLSLRMEKIEASSTVDINGTTFTVQQIPGNHIDMYTLYIDWEATTDEDRDPDWMGKVDYIAVTVTAVQID